ncbi:MarC family protein [Candidatus Giovannonibacteria bacterium]|nr:MarC family protein [Candidatus Giovannonibacteria bacterium]
MTVAGKISAIVAFLVMLNPFALFIFLHPVMKALSAKDFSKVLFKASLISFVIFFVFAATGNFVFEKIFQINFESFRIFGGIIIFTSTFLFVINGKKSLLGMQDDLGDIAAELALPFMVGAGTISLSILMGNKFRSPTVALLLAAVFAINFAVIILLKYLRSALPERLREAFDKFMELFLRINGFFMGAIALNMIIVGINNLYF